MGLLRWLVTGVLALSLVTFIALFGRLPALRNTPVAWLHRLLCISLPRQCRRLDEAFTGGRVTDGLSIAQAYLLHENHPLVLLFFLGLLTAASIAFLINAWPRLALWHHKVIPAVLVLPYVFTYLSARSKKSHITHANHAKSLVAYPYDYTIFQPGQICSTCLFVKPARSKHCSLCRVCVAKHDHHCAWVNNCLGQHNYCWFLLLLASTANVLLYGSALAIGLIAPHVPAPTAYKGDVGVISFIERWIQAARDDAWIGAIGMLASSTAPLALGLLAYHVYLIWAGMTTNETQKWANLREEMADGRTWKGHRLGTTSAPHVQGAQWPIQTDQIVVKTNDGKAPTFTDSQEGDIGTTGAWERCWHLGDVDNLYDIGFWDNFADVFFRR